MTHTSWKISEAASRNTVSDCAQSYKRRFWVTLLLLSLVLLGHPVGIRAANEQTGPFLFTSSARSAKDLEIEAKIRRALRQDPQIGPLNLGVHVNGGIAQLSGPVPTPELKQRAVAIAQRVMGVLSVNSKELYVSTSEQSGKRVLVFIPDDRPTQSRSASPGSRLGWKDTQITLQAPEMAAPARPSAKPEGGDRIGATRLTAHPHQPSLSTSISTAIERLRQHETRYQQIRTQVQGTTVYLFPGGTTSEDVMAFAQAVRRLPGVQHVILSTDPR